MRAAILIVMMDFLLSSLLIFIGPEGQSGNYLLNSSWTQPADQAGKPEFAAFSPRAVDAYFQQQIARMDEETGRAGAEAPSKPQPAALQANADALAAEAREKEKNLAREIQESKARHQAEMVQMQKALEKAEQDKETALAQERGMREQMLAQQLAGYKSLLEEARAREETSIRTAVQENSNVLKQELAAREQEFASREQALAATLAEKDKEIGALHESRGAVQQLQAQLAQKETSIQAAVQENSNVLKQEFAAREQEFASREQALAATLAEKDKEIGALHESRGAVQQLQAQLAQKDGEVVALHGELGAAKAQLAALTAPTVDAFVSDAQVEVHNEFAKEGRWGSDIKLEANLITVKTQNGDTYAVSSAESLGLLWKGMGSELKTASGYIAKRGEGASSKPYSTIYALDNTNGVTAIPLTGFAVNPLPLYKNVEQLRRSVNMQSLTFVSCAKDHEYTPFDAMNYTTHYKDVTVELRPKQTNNLLINSTFKMDIGKGDFVVSNNGFFIGVMIDDKSFIMITEENFIMITEENFSAHRTVFNLEDKQALSTGAAEYRKKVR